MEQAPFQPATKERQSLDEWILQDTEASFLMMMEGDAMHDHGIHHGDMLIVERASEARPNDLVIIVREGHWSVDAYNRLDHGSEECTIHAVIRGLVRKYE